VRRDVEALATANGMFSDAEAAHLAPGATAALATGPDVAVVRLFDL
jgi:hypothetical protein